MGSDKNVKWSDTRCKEYSFYLEAVYRAEQYGIAPMAGSTSKVEWATKIRDHMILNDSRLMKAVIERKANFLQDAGWWISNREVMPRDLGDRLNLPREERSLEFLEQELTRLTHEMRAVEIEVREMRRKAA